MLNRLRCIFNIDSKTKALTFGSGVDAAAGAVLSSARDTLTRALNRH